MAHTMSLSWRIGHAIIEARLTKKDPVKALCHFQGGIKVGEGKVTDIKRWSTGGFAKGTVDVTCEDASAFRVDFQNENLLIKDLKTSQVRLAMPDSPSSFIRRMF